jgi:serine/threonine-protein kinase
MEEAARIEEAAVRYTEEVATESMPDPGQPPVQGSPHALEPRRGLRLGRYELVTPIARGGMAEVWVARQLGDLGFRKLVAVKTIRAEYAENASFRRMFLDEARLAARIHHANVVEVLDLGEDGPIVFQAMTLIEGDSIAGLLRRWSQRGESGGLPPALAIRMLADAAAGLHAAHELTDDDGAKLLLVHRDVSPHNILVGLDGVAKIADFGIAKALGRLSDETEAGQVKGKFSYLSPEQVARTPPDRRSDVFACGIVLWEMLTGVRLFRGDDPVDTIEKVRSMRIPDVRDIAPGLAAPIAEATARALARDPNDRFPSAAAFAEARVRRPRLRLARVDQGGLTARDLPRGLRP